MIPTAAAGENAARELTAQAQHLVQANQTHQAAAIYAQLLELEPGHREALNFFGMQALADGDIVRSVSLFRRALARHKHDAALHKNLGLALRAQGSLQEALHAFDAALSIETVHPVVHLHRAALLEQMGKPEDALRGYATALSQAQELGIMARSDKLPSGMRQGLQRAIAVVQAARAEHLVRALQTLRSEHGDAALRRVEHSLRVYLGEEQPPPADPVQRCTFMTFQGIPAQGWFERSQFPWFTELEQRTDEIRAELLEILKADEGFRPFIEIPKRHPGAKYWESLNFSPDWNAFFFYRDGHRFDDNCRRCPITASLLDRLPLSRVADHSPETFFSVLKPGAHIPPHTGVINTRLVAHLPLIIPPDCGIRVGNEARGWQEGECLVFDDTFEHEAWNHGDQTRVVLIFDLWNPYLTEVEREAMRIVVEELGRFNRLHGQGDQAYGEQ